MWVWCFRENRRRCWCCPTRGATTAEEPARSLSGVGDGGGRGQGLEACGDGFRA
jgi:hypothetical protein